MKILLPAVISVFCLSFTSPAFAAHPLSTDDTGTNGEMKFQVETSAKFAWDKQESVNSESQSIGLSVSAGLTDTLDVSVGIPFTWQREKTNGVTGLDNSGSNDASLAIKWRFMGLGPVSFALKPAITFPSGDYDRSLGAGRPAYSTTLISTVEFKPAVVSANVGYTLQKYNDADKPYNRGNLLNISLAAAVEVMNGLQLVAEIGAGTNYEKARTDWPTFVTGGAIYSARGNLDLSLGIRGGLNAPETDIALLTGVTIKLP